MAKIGTYPNAADLTGTEEFIGVQSAASVNVTPEQLKQFINNPVYKNAAFTAKNGDAVFADSTSGPITITLPATPATNYAVSVKDCGGAASTQFITVGRNGQTIGGVAEDFVINQNFAQALFIYDGTDWKFALISNPTLINANTVFIVYKTSAYTAESGERVMCGTDIASFTVSLPASPLAGHSVGVWDAGNNALTNNITIDRNGETIDGLAVNDTLDVSGGHFEYIYNGTTWKRAFWAPGGLQLSNVVGVATDQFDPYRFTQISGETTRVQIAGRLDALQCPASGYNWMSSIYAFPKKWDGGQIRFRILWSPSTTDTGDIDFSLYGMVVEDGDLVSASLTNVGPTLVDTAGGTVDAFQLSPWSSWTSIETAVGENPFMLRLQGNGSAGTYTFTGLANVFWMQLQYTTNAPTDD
jgi:hypothetical protein